MLFPPRYLLGSGDHKASLCFPRGRILGTFWLIKSNLPFSSACGGVRNLFSSSTAIPGCQPAVQRQRERSPLCVCVCTHTCACVCMCMCVHACGEQGEVLPVGHAGVRRSHPRVPRRACVPGGAHLHVSGGCARAWRAVRMPRAAGAFGGGRPFLPLRFLLLHLRALCPHAGERTSGTALALRSVGRREHPFGDVPMCRSATQQPPGWGLGCGTPGRLGKGFGDLFLQHPGAKRKLRPCWVTGAFGNPRRQIPRLG